MTLPGTATGLDHVGVAVPDLDAAAVEWLALGFVPQPLARHMADDRPTGTGNRNIMLRHGYIELLASIDPARPSATLARFLARHTGIHILTLAMDDPTAALDRLHRAGFTAALARSSRPADPTDPDGPQATFARIPLTDADPRLQLLHQITPALVWQERFLTHPNRATALRSVLIAADPPADFAARLSRLAGLPLAPDPAGGYVLDLPGSTIRIIAPDTAIASLPCITGVVVQTDDANQAVARLLPQAPRLASAILAQASRVTVMFIP